MITRRLLLITTVISIALFSENCVDAGAPKSVRVECPEISVPATVVRLGGLADSDYSARIRESGLSNGVSDIHQVWKFARNASVVMLKPAVSALDGTETVFNVAIAVEEGTTKKVTWARSFEENGSPTTVSTFFLALDPGRGVTILGGRRERKDCQIVIIERDEARGEFRSRTVPNTGKWPL